MNFHNAVRPHDMHAHKQQLLQEQNVFTYYVFVHMKYLMLIVIISKTQVFRNRKEVQLALLFLIPCLFSPACINHLISRCHLTNTGYFLFTCGIRVPAGKVIAIAAWIFSFNRRFTAYLRIQLPLLL